MRTKIGLFSVAALTAVAAYTGCVSSDKGADVAAAGGAVGRDVAASSVVDQPTLIFHSIKARRGSTGVEFPIAALTEVMTPTRWANFKQQAAARYQKLLEFYFANSRSRSDSGRRNIACFTGKASDVKREFFENVSFKDVEELRVSTSSDGLMLGVDMKIRYRNQWTRQHFRMPSCLSAGKNFFFDPRELVGEINNQKARDARASRQPQSEEISPPSFTDADVKAALSRTPSGVEAEGYAMLDPGPAGAESGKLPRFQLKSDYDNSHRVRDELPWRKERLDLGKDADAMRFAMILKKYVYDGMGNQSPNPNLNLIAQRAPRYWCHMPWLNQGPAGREAIHGLTQERDLYPSKMYPEPSPGSDWGVAVFNAPACQAIDRTFGPAKSPRIPPKTPQEWHMRANSDDGSVIAKFLFTTAVFPQIVGAWQLIAHVSPPKATTRSLMPVRHIQLDIGVKDSTLRGVPVGNADNWIMLTYYYDADYLESADIGANMPVGIKKMRPVGLQWGFTPRDSKIFKGALTNNDAGLLNGPADNPKSSCLGCHGAAGTDVKMAPGVLTAEQFRQIKGQRVTLDFGQQFAFAKRNYETRSQATP